jgi:polysaccharide biosynthesis/export protein
MHRFLLLILLAALLSACANKSLYPPAPAKADGASDWNYVLGPGDSVSVFVWGNPEVSGGFTIRPDGKLTMSLAEDLPATGRTPTQLAREIERVLSKYIQDPIVTVTVGGGIGPYSQQIRVLGQATKPQSLSYREQMSLLDLMIAVGGITDFADGNRASILRVVDGKPQQFGVRIDDLIKNADVSANVEMRPGDVLIIPERWF